ncbi:MAG: stalk domain-containing protein, partial [candidate division FCPU426 bacterium]
VKQIAEKLGLKTKRSKKSLVIELVDGPVTLKVGDENIASPAGVYPKLLAAPVLVDSEIYVPLDSVPYFLDVVVNYQEGQGRFSIKRSPIHLKPKPRRAEATEEPTLEPTEEPTLVPTKEPTPRPTEKPTPEPTPGPVVEATAQVVKQAKALGSEFRDGKTWVDVKQIAEKLGLKTKRTRKTLVIELPDGPVTLKVGDDHVSSPNGIYPRLLAPVALVNSELYVPLDSVPYFLDVVVSYQEGQDRFSIKKSPIHLKPRPLISLATPLPTEIPTLLPTQKATPVPTEKPTIQPTQEPTSRPTPQADLKGLKRSGALRFESRDGKTWVDAKQIAEKLGLKTKRTKKTLVIDLQDGPVTLKAGDDSVSSPNGIYPKLLAPAALINSELYVPLESVPYFLDVVVSYQEDQQRFAIKKSPIHLKPRPLLALPTIDLTPPPTEKPTLVPTEAPTVVETPEPTARPTRLPDNRKRLDTRRLDSEKRDGQTWVKVRQVADLLKIKSEKRNRSLILYLPYCSIVLTAGSQAIECAKGAYPPLSTAPIFKDSELWLPLDALPLFLDIVIRYDEKGSFSILPAQAREGAAALSGIPDRVPTVEPQRAEEKPLVVPLGKGGAIDSETRGDKVWVRVRQVAELLELRNHVRGHTLSIELPDCEVTLTEGSKVIDCVKGSFPDLDEAPVFKDNDLWLPLDSLPLFLDVLVKYQKNSKRFVITKNPLHLRPRSVVTVTDEEAARGTEKEPTASVSREIEETAPKAVPVEIPEKKGTARFGKGKALRTIERDKRSWVMVKQVAEMLKLKSKRSAKGRKLSIEMPDCEITLAAGNNGILCATRAYPNLDPAPVLIASELWLPLESMPFVFDVLVRFDETTQRHVIRKSTITEKFVSKEGAASLPLKEPYWGYGLYGNKGQQSDDNQDLNPDGQFPQAVEFAGSFTDQSYWNPYTGVQDINLSTLALMGNIGDYSVGLDAQLNHYLGQNRLDGALQVSNDLGSLRVGDVQRSMGRLSVASGRRRGVRLSGAALSRSLSAYYSPASWNTDRVTPGRPEANVMGVDLGLQAGPGQYSAYLRRTSLVDGLANSLVAAVEADLGFARGRSISGSFALSAGEQAQSPAPASAYRGELRSTQGILIGNAYYQKIGDGFDASGQSRAQYGVESMGLGSTLALNRTFKPYYRVQRYVRHLSAGPASSVSLGETLGLLMSARPGLQFELSGSEQELDGLVNSQGLDLSGRMNGPHGSSYAKTGIRRMAAYPDVTNYHGELQLDLPLGGSSSFGVSSSLGGRMGLVNNPALFDFINNSVRLNYRSWDESWGARLQVGHRMSPEGLAGSYGQTMSALLNLDIRLGLWNLRPEINVDGIRLAEGAAAPTYAGNLFVSYDFSFKGVPIKAALFGVVYDDLNHNHRRDPGEPGVRHIDIHLDGGDVAQTDDEGRFAFNGLMPEFHRLDLDTETVPPEYFKELSTNKTFDLRQERVQEWELGLER